MQHWQALRCAGELRDICYALYCLKWLSNEKYWKTYQMFLWQRHEIHVRPLPLGLNRASHVSIQGRYQWVTPSASPSGHTSSSNVGAILVHPCHVVCCHVCMQWKRSHADEEHKAYFDCAANSSVHFTALLNSPPSWDISCPLPYQLSPHHELNPTAQCHHWGKHQKMLRCYWVHHEFELVML